MSQNPTSTEHGSDVERNQRPVKLRPTQMKSRRANALRGSSEPPGFSYAPVEAISRAVDILAVVNQLGVASIENIHSATHIPKPTIVRMLETLIFKGLVARDNMCRGYHVTGRMQELASGYGGVPRMIEISRPLAIDLTKTLKWPVGIGVIAGDEVVIQFWTGTISPVAHTGTVLGIKPDMRNSAMGRCFLAFCSPEEREKHFEKFRRSPVRKFDRIAERSLLEILERTRTLGYSVRDPQQKPYRTSTVAMPITLDGRILGLMSLSFFWTAVHASRLVEEILAPLRETTEKIQSALAYMHEPRATTGLDDIVEPHF